MILEIRFVGIINIRGSAYLSPIDQFEDIHILYLGGYKEFVGKFLS